MNACINPNTTASSEELAASLNHLQAPVADLLQRITYVEPMVHPSEDNTVLLASPLEFPDGIGSGSVVGKLFRYRDEIRLDIRVEHNRVFARSDGGPSERRCFLNDYIASMTVPAGTESLPETFVRSVVAGVTAARDAVRRHNSQVQAPWNEIRVAMLDETPV